MINVIKRLAALVAIAATLFVASAAANNGIQFSTFTIEDVIYFDCLGEHVRIQSEVRSAYHEFETPSGTYHLLDNWKGTELYTGLLTGRTWVGKWTAPFQINAKKGEVLQFQSIVNLKPLTGDGPHAIFKAFFKVTVNANGELVVYRGSGDDPSGLLRCLGKK